MEVTCPKCKTVYDFEDTLIGPRGTVVRCTQCGFMFKIFREESPDAIESAGWMLRKRDGTIYNLDHFSLLQKWIVEGKVTPQDELSRTGKLWKKLGEIVELSGLFKTAQASSKGKIRIEEMPTSKYKAPSVKKIALEPRASVTPAVEQEPEWQEIKPSGEEIIESEPAVEFRRSGEGTINEHLTKDVEPSQELYSEEESILKPVYQPGGKRVVLVIGILAAAIGVVYFGYLYREVIFKWTGMLKEPGGTSKDIGTELEEAAELSRTMDEGSFKKALLIYEGILKKAPGNVDALVSLSQLQARKAQLIKDKIEFKNIFKVTPENKKKYEREFLKLTVESLRNAEKAREIAPDSSRVKRAYADALRLSGDVEKASRIINGVLEVKPSDGKAIYIQTLLDYEIDGDIKNAINGMKRALRREPDLVEAGYHLGLFLIAGGPDSDSLKKFTELSGRFRDSRPIQHLVAILQARVQSGVAEADASTSSDVVERVEKKLVAEKQRQQGEKKLSGAEERKAGGVASGRSYDFYIKKANKLQNQGNSAKALQYFQEAVAIQPSSSEAWTGVAYCYLDMGRRGDAINSFRKALKYNSRYGPAIIGLAETYKSQGKFKLALEHYRRYLEVFPSGPKANLARRNTQELEDMLKAKGKLPSDASARRSTEVESSPGQPGQGSTVIKRTETEVKSSMGQPTSDTPKIEGDPYD